VTDWWFSPCTPVSSTTKTDHCDITEILLKESLNIITPLSGQYLTAHYFALHFYIISMGILFYRKKEFLCKAKKKIKNRYSS
jgi:hypothetical protein